jgi:hypothetical protein
VPKTGFERAPPNRTHHAPLSMVDIFVFLRPKMHGLILLWLIGAGVYQTTLAYSSTVRSGLSPWARFLRCLGTGMKNEELKATRIHSINTNKYANILFRICVPTCTPVHTCIHRYCMNSDREERQQEGVRERVEANGQMG